jgi:hypothetical protein
VPAGPVADSLRRLAALRRAYGIGG